MRSSSSHSSLKPLKLVPRNAALVRPEPTKRAKETVLTATPASARRSSQVGQGWKSKGSTSTSHNSALMISWRARKE